MMMKKLVYNPSDIDAAIGYDNLIFHDLDNVGTTCNNISIKAPPGSAPGTFLKIYTDPIASILKELKNRLDTMEARLLILHENVENHEQYPVLKDLYDQYKMVEAMLSGPKKDDTDRDN